MPDRRRVNATPGASPGRRGLILLLALVPPAGALPLCATDGLTANNLSTKFVLSNETLQLSSQLAANMYSYQTCVLRLVAPAGYSLTFSPNPSMDVRPGSLSVYTNASATNLTAGVNVLGFAQLPPGARCSGDITWG